MQRRNGQLKINFKLRLSLLALALVGFVFAPLLARSVYSETKPNLVMATEAGYKPFDYLDESGQVVGFDVDLAREIAKDQGRELEINNLSFDALLTALQSGKADMVLAAMTVTPERQRNVNFSNPYYQASQKIIVRAGETKIKGKRDLVGQRIGVQLGTTGEESARTIEGAKISALTEVATLMSELGSGKIDAVIVDDQPAKLYAGRNGNFKILAENLSEESYAIAVRKDDTELLAKINATIARLKVSDYDRMLCQYELEAAEYQCPEDVARLEITSGQSKMDLSEIFFGEGRYKLLIEGLGLTLIIAFSSTVVGVVLGLLSALMRIIKWQPLRFLAKGESVKGRRRKLAEWRPLASLSRIYTTVIRGTPLLVQMLIIYYVVFANQKSVEIASAMIAFGVNSGAYVSEILRAAFENINKGQWEAAKSLGFSYTQTIRMIILPQVLKATLPSLINEFITLIKETSIVGWIGVTDLMRGADMIRFQTATAFESLLAVALIYLSLTTIFTRLTDRAERKLKVGD